MSSDVWVGTAVSVPVSLGVALAATYVQRWIDKHGEASHAKKRDRIRDEYHEVLHYALYTDLLLGRMLVTIINLIVAILFVLIGLIIVPGIESAALIVFHPSEPHMSKSHAAAMFVGCLSIMLAALIAWVVTILKMAWTYIRLFYNVRSFKTYVKSIPADLRNAKLERLVECAREERAIPKFSWENYRSRPDEPNPDPQLEGSTE